MLMFRIRAVMSGMSTRQDRISFDCSGASMKPWLPKLNAESALRWSSGSWSIDVECISVLMPLIASVASLTCSDEKFGSPNSGSCLVRLA